MSTLRVTDHDGGVRRVAFDRPPANAIDEALLSDLVRTLEEARAAGVRALVLTGHGSFFCGGFDFSAPRRDDVVATDFYALYRKAHLDLLTFPAPTVAMVAGHAVAGGLVLALACDYRLGAEGDYRVGLNEVAVGASFPGVAFEIVRLRLSHARAAEMILGAALYPAGQALRLGLVDELLPASTLEETVLRRAARLAAFPREAYLHAKQALVADAVAHVHAETDEQSLAAMSVWISPESRAARKRQKEKLGKRDAS